MASDSISGVTRSEMSEASERVEQPTVGQPAHAGTRTWVFGYGSLVWRPAFPAVERVAGSIEGWRRRFWQGSTDHRGVPGAPGRVVTLERDSEARCGGVAYRLPEDSRDATLNALDVREQGGYEQREERCSLTDGRTVRCLVYVATPDNPNFLGAAPLGELARQIVASSGPSGDNSEYLLRLDQALAELGFQDEHVAGLASAVRALIGAECVCGSGQATAKLGR